MDPDHLLAMLEPMLANFKRELEELRAAEPQSDVERMLDDFEERYAEDEESKLVVEILRRLHDHPTSGRPPTECDMPEGEAPGSNEETIKRAPVRRRRQGKGQRAMSVAIN